MASAPVSWGVFENKKPPDEYPFPRVMDEIAAAGYSGTELGPYGFYPTDAAELRKELDRRRLTLCSAFVAVHWGDPQRRREGLGHLERSASLVGSLGCRLLILSDEITRERSAVAGRAGFHPQSAWTNQQWRDAAKALREAIEVGRGYGLRVAFHPHVGTHVETPDEVERLLHELGDEMGLCLDTGHCFYGGGDPLDTLRRYWSRVLCLHLKDVSPSRLELARRNRWDFYEAVRQGVFARLGQGGVDFPALVRILVDTRFSGWVVVEQDVLEGGQGAESPLANAQAGCAYLKKLGV